MDNLDAIEINTIYHTSAKSLLTAMSKSSVDLIVTSPPYNLKNSTGTGMKSGGKSGKWANAALKNGYSDHDDNMPHEAYVQWQRDILLECMRVLSPCGAIFYNHKWRVQNGLLQDRQDIVAGFPVRQVIIWKRAGGMNFNKGYFLPTFEVIYLIAKPSFKLAPKANAYGDVWEIPQELNTQHPAPFPFRLAERCILATTAQKILDPFMGSGTVALAAQQLGRSYIGCDISAEYVALARARLAKPYALPLLLEAINDHS